MAAIILSGCDVLLSDYLSDDDSLTESDDGSVFLFADDNIVPEGWEIRYSEPPNFNANDSTGRWYLFNIYTIDQITPDDMDFLLFSFEVDSKNLYLKPLETEYIGASNFRAWVYIPDSYIESNNLWFNIERPDKKQIMNFERLNFRISNFKTQYDGNAYYWMTVPYEENSSAAEFRKIVRTWEDVELQDQDISFDLSFDTELETEDVSFEGIYTCAPRTGGGTSTL